MKREPAIAALAPDRAAPLIELANVTRTYRSGELAVQALRGVSLVIYPGEFVAIMGASGSGKTTLMNILGCLDRPSGGTYRFRGEDVSQLDRDALARLRREAFGFVFQSYNLIATSTAVENVEVPAMYAGLAGEARHARAAELLVTLGLADRLDHRPNELSGGQQQRVSIARALMNGGEIILADEPTGALDSKSGDEVLGLLRQLAARGHTVIVITHASEVAAHAQRVIELKDGEVVRDDGPAVPAVAPARAHESLPDREGSALVNDTVEAARTAARALRVNMFRTALTLLGIVIGVASVIVMLAVGNGAKRAVLDRISGLGTNLLLVRPGAPNQRGQGANLATLVPDDATAVAGLPNVLAAVPEMSGNVTIRFGNADYQTQIIATSAAYPLARNWPVVRGTFFSDSDVRSYATVVVLGQTVIKNLFPAGVDPIGHYVLINNVLFQVIGVMDARGATPWGADQDDILIMPLTTGSLRLLGKPFLRNITVAVDDVAQIDATQSAIEALLADRHRATDFQIRNMASIIQTAEETQNTLTVLLGSIAAISLLVGGIGVMNIMLVNVTERTREIGIRMATGARMRDILQQFLGEALLVSGLGGLIGVGVGLGAAALIGMFGRPIEFSMGPVAIAFGCAFLTGLVFGFMPARKAARLDPVVALAAE
jgi:macrolide transport system ATP-binding/permease protein